MSRPPGAPGAPSVGSRVRLVGCLRASLNDAVGTITGVPTDSGRVPVQLHGQEKMVLIMPDHLELLALPGAGRKSPPRVEEVKGAMDQFVRMIDAATEVSSFRGAA